MERPVTRISATVIGAPDAQRLADFYEELLGWIRVHVWPAEPGRPAMTMHLDIGVEELDAGVAWATSIGATLAAHQPQEGVRVMLDPVGNPFCLFPAPPAVQQVVE